MISWMWTLFLFEWKNISHKRLHKAAIHVQYISGWDIILCRCAHTHIRDWVVIYLLFIMFPTLLTPENKKKTYNKLCDISILAQEIYRLIKSLNSMNATDLELFSRILTQNCLQFWWSCLTSALRNVSHAHGMCLVCVLCTRTWVYPCPSQNITTSTSLMSM